MRTVNSVTSKLFRTVYVYTQNITDDLIDPLRHIMYTTKKSRGSAKTTQKRLHKSQLQMCQ
jgi:hypothetical protein